jgi:signal transduction histidine kinase
MSPLEAETNAEEVSMKILRKSKDVQMDTEERKMLLNLRSHIDEALKGLTRDYHQMQGINGQLRVRAKEAAAELKLTKSKLRSAREDVKMCHVREANLLNHLLGGLKSTLGIIEDHIVQLASDGGKSGAKSLDQVRAEVHRLWQIVTNLATVEAVQLGTSQLKLEEVNVANMVEHVVLEHQGMAESRRVALNEAIARGLPVVLGDQYQLKMALNYLLDNAIAHTPLGGSVTIRANGDQTRGWVKLSVMDMRKDTLGKMDMLSQKSVLPSNRQLEAEIGCFDLELMAAWQIIAMHKGEITVDSQAESGTTFTLSLPTAENGRGGKNWHY